MALISLAEYAQMHGKAHSSVQQKAQRGGFKTAQKIGRNWVIDSEEPYEDGRVTSGKYRDWRKGINTMQITNKAGKAFELSQWDAIINLMDADIVEALHLDMAPCSEQEFFAAYEAAHEEKYGEEWELSKSNPEW